MEDESAAHIGRGYFRRRDGTLGTVEGGVKRSESEESYASSQSAKRARHKLDSSPSPSASSPEAPVDLSFLYKCNNTHVGEDGEEVRCDGETNGSSQLCHFCSQALKRSFFM